MFVLASSIGAETEQIMKQEHIQRVVNKTIYILFQTNLVSLVLYELSFQRFNNIFVDVE